MISVKVLNLAEMVLGFFFWGFFLILWLLKVFDGGLLMNRNNSLVYLSGLFDFSVKM